MALEEEQIFRDLVKKHGASVGLSLSDSLLDGLAVHYRLLCKWAQKINLTTVLEPDEAAKRHAIDCLLLAEVFPEALAKTVVDVGSGAGFPGIVLALARPKLSLTLMEPQRKRASFLRVVLAELGRNDVSVVEARLENVRGKSPWTADAIVSRATIPPLDLVAMARPYLNPGGELILMEGAGAPDEQTLERCASASSFVLRERRVHSLPWAETRIIDVLRLDGR